MGFIEDCRGIYDENRRTNIPSSKPIEQYVKNHVVRIQSQIKSMLRCDKHCENGSVHFFYRCGEYEREMIKKSGFFHRKYESLYRFTCVITPDIVNIMQQVSNALEKDGVYVSQPFLGHNAKGYVFLETNHELDGPDYYKRNVVTYVKKINSNMDSFESWIHFVPLDNITENINQKSGIFVEVTFNIR